MFAEPAFCPWVVAVVGAGEKLCGSNADITGANTEPGSFSPLLPEVPLPAEAAAEREEKEADMGFPLAQGTVIGGCSGSAEYSLRSSTRIRGKGASWNEPPCERK